MVKTHGCYYLTKFRSKHNTHNSSHLYNQVLGISTQVSTDPNIEAGARNTSKWDFWAHSASLPIRCNTKRHRKNPRLGRNQPKAIPTKTLKKSKTWSDTTKGNSNQDLEKIQDLVEINQRQFQPRLRKNPRLGQIQPKAIPAKTWQN